MVISSGGAQPARVDGRLSACHIASGLRGAWFRYGTRVQGLRGAWFRYGTRVQGLRGAWFRYGTRVHARWSPD